MFGKRSKITSIDKDDIAKRVDQFKVWNWLLGFNVQEGDRFSNPFRLDNKPNCRLVSGYKWVFLQDHSDSSFHNWTILHATMHKFNVNFDTACSIVWHRFVDKTIIPETVSNQVILKEHKCIIHFTPVTYNNKIAYLPRDKDFWTPLGISSDQLKQDYTYSVLKYRYNDRFGRNFQIYPNNCSYAFTFPSGNVKIYNPYRTDGKWISNCGIRDIGFINKIPDKGEVLFICKSYKDCRIHKNMGFNAIWIQGETFKIPDDILVNLASRFKVIYVYFDNDKTGIGASKLLCNTANRMVEKTTFIPIWLPENLYLEKNIKDNGDYILAYNQNKLKKLINNLTNGSS